MHENFDGQDQLQIDPSWYSIHVVHIILVHYTHISRHMCMTHPGASLLLKSTFRRVNSFDLFNKSMAGPKVIHVVAKYQLFEGHLLLYHAHRFASSGEEEPHHGQNEDCGAEEGGIDTHL